MDKASLKIYAMNSEMGTGIILDDHQFFGEAFAVMMEHNGFLDAAFVFTEPAEVRKFIIQHREGPLYLFLDYHIPNVNVLQVINDVRRLYPTIRIVMVSSITNAQIVGKILAYKPEGFLSKTAGIDELADCFNCIRKNQAYVSPFIQSLLDDAPQSTILDSFTAKEIEVLNRIALGENIEAMAKALSLSRNTIIVHRRNMMAKAGVTSVIALLALAIKEGVVSSHPATQ